MDNKNVETEILDFISRNHIVCPLPQPWNQLVNWLLKFERERLGDESLRKQDVGLMNPLILAAWHVDDEKKMARFREHIKWAFERGQARVVYQHLLCLSADKYAFRQALTPCDLDLDWSPLKRNL